MILSCWDISCDHWSSFKSHNSYIIGSYEYLSTKRPTTKQRTETKHYAETSNESTNVQLVTSDIKTATTSETDDIEMQNSEMNISATTKLTSAKPCSTLRRLQLLPTDGFLIDFKRLKLCTRQESPNGFSYVQDKQNRCKLHCKSLCPFSTKLASHKAEQVISPNVILLKSGEPRTKKSYTT